MRLPYHSQLTNLLNYALDHTRFWVLAAGFYLVLTVPALFSTHHALFNLEPYPDGLLYALSGRNLALGEGFVLTYQGHTVQPWVPALYGVVLAIGYLFWHAPATFYVVNLFLGVTSIYLLSQIASQLALSKRAYVSLVLTYLLHGYMLWLPSVPMSENLLITTFLLVVFALSKPAQTLQSLLVSVGALCGLVLTRYSVLPVTLVLAVWWLKQLYVSQLSLKTKVILLGTLSGVGLAFGIMLQILGTNPWQLFIKIVGYLATGTPFYNISFMIPNFLTYTGIVFGKTGPFLWNTFRFTSLPVALVSLIGLGSSSFSGKNTTTAQALLGSFLAQFVILLIFYTVDARYIILSIPIVSLGVALGVERITALPHYLHRYAYGLLILVIIGHGLFQAPLYKYLVSANLLHTTRAWQLESIQHFDEYFRTKPDQTLITALPPYYIQAFQKSSYSVLPLSLHQEFANKQLFPWGDTLKYQDLATEFSLLLKEKQTLYISNAYITHHQAVITDFEKYKTTFKLTLVSSGCQEACNIYTLELVTNDQTP